MDFKQLSLYFHLTSVNTTICMALLSPLMASHLKDALQDVPCQRNF